MTVSSLDELFIQSGNIEVTADATYFDGTVDFSGAVNAKSAKFTAVTVGTVNVSEMDTEIQALTGHTGSLQTQLNEMRVRFADLYPIRYPLQHLNQLTGSRVSFSTEVRNVNGGISAFMAFDGIYGEDAVSVYNIPARGGWESETETVDDQSSLTIDGVLTFGDFVYLDLLPDTSSAIITSFQIYAASTVFPTSYQIVGSNDSIEWTSLFKETALNYEATYPHGDQYGAYSSVTPVTRRDKHHRFVGIIVESHPGGRAYIQELLLWGG
jgi:hypothetical protein